MARIGLLGGTFDPVHNGHLQLAEAVLQTCDLDKILFIPAAHPPHKNQAIVCAIEHRLHMLKLGIGERKEFQISEIEISRTRASYTIETVEELRRSSGTDTRYHFILGYDALFEIETWHRWDELLASTNFIVAVRPGFSLKEIEQLLKRNGFRPARKGKDRWVHRQHANEVWFLADEIVDISSTDIRARILSARTWKNLVPPSVATYIMENRLYAG